MSKKILSLLGTVFVIAAFMALPAMASAAPQLRIGGTEAAANQTISAFSATLTRTSAAGKFECTESTINAKVLSNRPPVARVTSSSFTGTGGVMCKTTIPSPTGGTLEAEVRPEGHWCLTLGANDEWHLTKCPGTSRNVGFIWHFSLPAPNRTKIAECRYERESVRGTYTRSPNALALTVGANQVFALSKSVPAGACAPNLTLAGFFTITSSEGAVTVDAS